MRLSTPPALAATSGRGRRSGDRLAATLPGRGPGPEATQAYAVQDAYIAAMGEPVVGWKVGMTNAAAQAAGRRRRADGRPPVRLGRRPKPGGLETPPEALRI